MFVYVNSGSRPRRLRPAAALSYTALEAFWKTSCRPVRAPRRTGVTILLEVIAVLLIVLANGFFVAAEYALVTARRSRLQELADNGMRRAKIAIRIMDSPVRFIGTVQLGITAFDPPRYRRRAARRQLDRRAAVARRRVRPRVRLRHIPARDARRARAEGHCADEERGDGTLGGVSDRGRLRHLLPHRVVLPGVRQRDDEARGHRAGAGRRHRPLRGHPPHRRTPRRQARSRKRSARCSTRSSTSPTRRSPT